MIRFRMFFRISILSNIFLICLAICLKSHASELNTKNYKIVMGTDDALVKIKIFSSLTCPHCANFHIEVIPQIKKNYVDTGKVQLIFIDFPLDLAAFNASKLLHCLDEKKQISFLDTLYENQKDWVSGKNIEEINNNLINIVDSMGITKTQFNKCLNNEMIEDKILIGRIDGHKKYSIDSTPTIVINEVKFEGVVNFKNIKKKIDKLI